MIKKIFLETNALYSLGPKLENVDFATLQGFREFTKFELFVVETSWKEYLRHRKKELSDCLVRHRQNRGMLEKQGHAVDGLDHINEQIEESLRTLEQHYNKRAEAIGITVVPVPPIDVHVLLEMSLAGEPPFDCAENESGEKTKEKGFRDATIMFTILESIRGQEDVLIVTSDGPLKRGIEQRAKEYDTSPLIVAKVADGVQAVTDRVVQWYKEHKKQEGREAIELVLRHQKEIVASVAEVRELSEIDLGQSYLSVTLSTEERNKLDIERVLSLDFESIDTAVWKDRDKATSRILFKVICKARVLASPRTPYPYSFATPNFAIGGEKQNPLLKLWGLARSEQPSEHELPVLLYGEAHFERVDGGWRLTNLKLEKSFSDEWFKSAIKYH